PWDASKGRSPSIVIRRRRRVRRRGATECCFLYPFPAAKIGFWPPLEVENPFLQEMDASNENGIPIPFSFEGCRKYFFRQPQMPCRLAGHFPEFFTIKRVFDLQRRPKTLFA
ncbi:MAG: hypothetical protein IK099_01055, partial [Clostridia bacterium]|nr:hypothetical protein [Clostridia bacterium]